MNPVPDFLSAPVPSRWLRAFAWAARWLFIGALTAWLLLVASWGFLHGWIVPRIAQYRPLVEQQATRVLGVPVRIGSISAESVGWVPSFALNDVSFHDAAGRPALSLGRVVVALSPQSLAHLGFEQLYIEKPELDIRRLADGRITVAGLAADGAQSTDDSGLEWLLEQKELVIRDGSVRWTDDLRGAPALSLTGVGFLMRNTPRRHAFRLDAQLPSDWGNEKFTATAQFRQPLFSLRKSHWREWDGRMYADAPGVDVAQLRQYLDMGRQIQQGRGALRAWVDIKRGEVTSGTVDMALAEVSASVAPELEPLVLRSITGRMSLAQVEAGFDFSALGLKFMTHDGRYWPGGNMHLNWRDATARQPARAALHADLLDLQALSQIAAQLPMEQRFHAALKTYAPAGIIEKLDATWEAGSTPNGASKFSAKGKAQNLRVAAGPLPVDAKTGELVPNGLGTPGVRGAELDFDLNQAGGKGRIAIQSGSIELPGVFAEPVVPLDRMSADVQWTVAPGKHGDKISVQASRLQFGNADTEGEARATWRTDDDVKHGSRFPGVLDLQGSISRGDAARIHRYLPLVIPQEAREYVHASILQGKVQGVKFRLKGDLYDMPFADAKKGEFRISANFQNASFAYVPPYPAGTPPLWPALNQMAGELIVDRANLQVKGVTGKVDGLPGVQITRGEGLIPRLGGNLVVQVNADARGPLADALGFVTKTPINDWTSKALAKATGTGNADYKVRLNLPIADLEKTRVQGTVTLAGNDVQIAPMVPAFGKVRGAVQFTESGFNLQGIQALFLGGEARAEGGTLQRAGGAGAASSASAGAQRSDQTLLFRAQGTATAEGLRQADELGIVARLAQNATGSAAYTAAVGFRRGQPEINVASNLQGLAINLPPPLNKAAESVLPLRYDNRLITGPVMGPGTAQRLQDQLVVDLGQLGSVQYVRDISGDEAKVLRGGIGVGLSDGESVPVTDEGVAANIRLVDVDLDAWGSALSRIAGVPLQVAAPVSSAAVPAAMAYLPTTLALRARTVQASGHSLHDVVLGGGRDGLTWRTNLDSTELSGYLEYRQSMGANPGRVFARLARLNIPASSQKEVEALLEEQPTSIPALDIVVEDMELRGKKLGRIEIDAVNRNPGSGQGAREWRLNRFNVIVPEARFSAVGNWVALGAGTAAGVTGMPAVERGGRPAPEVRRTALNYTLDISNAGELLNRLGMKDLVGKGSGKLEGQVAWIGSPLALDYPSLGGQFHVNLESGQFLKVPVGGAAKLLGVLSLQSLPRRLTLDFRDVFSDGFAFDFVRGDVRIEQGIATTNNLQMKGVNAAVLMEGQADIARETQDLKVVVVPEINAGTASLVASVINPVIGLTTFLTQMILRQPLISAATQEFHIEGTWADPKVVPVDRKAAEAAAKALDYSTGKAAVTAPPPTTTTTPPTTATP